MSITIKDTDQGLGNLIKLFDHVDTDEFYQAYVPHLTQPADILHKYLYSITDLTDLIAVDVNSDAIREIAHLCNKLSEHNSHLVTATIANTDLLYGMARMWAAIADETSWEITIVNNMEEAQAWVQSHVSNKHNIENLSFK